MKKPELQLTRYFFPVVSIMASPDHKPGEETSVAIDIETNITPVKNSKNLYQLTLKIELADEEGAKASYTGMLQAIGFFSVNKKMKKKDAGLFIHTNGTITLYAMAREYLMTITGRGPWKPIMLPTIDAPTADELQLMD